MPDDFNLIDEPWLPCLMSNGEHREFGIRNLLTHARTIRELHDESPLVTVALHRLLLALLHRIFGPQDMADWGMLWKGGKFPVQPMDDYLDQWHGRFALFHDRWPFYQTGGMRTEKPLPASALFEELTTGHNATLFDHTVDSSSPGFKPARVARGLVMRQSFALGLGVSPSVTINGQTIKTGNRQDAPLARGVVLLVKGESLFRTLMLNLSEYQPSDTDIPIWEHDNPETKVNKAHVDGRLDLYTAQCRRLRLVPPDAEDALVLEVHFAQGRKLSNEIDPMKPYQVKDERKGPRVIRLQQDKALWRDSTTLMELARKRKANEQDLGAAALTLVDAAKDAGCLPNGFIPEINLFGLATQKGRATSVIFWRHERLPLPLEYLTDKALVGDLKKALDLAEAVAKALCSSAWRAGKTALKPNKEVATFSKKDREAIDNVVRSLAPERLYWSRLETPFKRLLLDLPGDAAHRMEQVRHWFRDTLRPAAWDAYNRTAGTLESSARAFRATVTGEQRLAYELDRIILKHDLKETTPTGDHSCEPLTMSDGSPPSLQH